MKYLLFLVGIFSLILHTQASEVIKLEGISIQGHDEEPHVMYITPWQEPPGTGKLYREATSFREQWLHTLDDERLKYEMALPETFMRPQQETSETE